MYRSRQPCVISSSNDVYVINKEQKEDGFICHKNKTSMKSLYMFYTNEGG